LNSGALREYFLQFGRRKGARHRLCAADMKARELYSANRYFEVSRDTEALLFGKDQKKLALDKEGYYKWVGS
jgi:hypothetical protein